MFCENCGREIKAEESFCPACGMRVKPTDGEHGMIQRKRQRKRKDNKSRKINREVIVLLAVVLVVLTGALVFVFILAGRSDSRKEINVEKETNMDTEHITETENYTDTEYVTETENYTDTEYVTETENYTDTEYATETESNAETEAEQESDEYVETEKQSEVIQAQTAIPQINMSCISSIEATSELQEGNITHSVAYICDGYLSNAWVEGVSGQGEGESVRIGFDSTYGVNGILFNAGYQKSSDLYYKNSRPSEMDITFSDGTSMECFLEDFYGVQVIEFPERKETSWIMLTIKEVYEGNKYEDTVISEVEFY